MIFIGILFCKLIHLLLTPAGRDDRHSHWGKTTVDPKILISWNAHSRFDRLDQSIVVFQKKSFASNFLCNKILYFVITRVRAVHRNDLLINGLMRSGIDSSVLQFWLALLGDGKHRMHDQNYPIEWCRFDHPGAMMLTAEQIWRLIWWSALVACVLVLLLLQPRWSHFIVSLHRLQTPLPQHLTGTRLDNAIPRCHSPAEG